MQLSDEAIVAAASALLNAKTFIITAGAGMGVDSGLPDFRGDHGFWKAYPLYQKLGLSFVEMATPRHFGEDPKFGWGFYGHRTNLYRETVPHRGFKILQDWCKRYQLEWFVVTSNVDGHFQKAGFDEQRVVEIHGSIHQMQCTTPCRPDIWENDAEFSVDLETMRCESMPACHQCGAVARPNVLMFNDWSYVPQRSAAQQRRFDHFLSNCPRPIVVVEVGAGSAVPTIRWTSEDIGNLPDATVIRINPREPKIGKKHISIAAEALITLDAIETVLLAKA